MKRIEGFRSFEAVGVPTGLVDISVQLYDRLSERIRKGMYTFDQVDADPDEYRYPVRHLLFSTNIPMKDSKVNDYVIKSVDMTVSVEAVSFGEEDAPKGKHRMAGAGYAPKTKIDRKNFKTVFVDNGEVDMNIKLVLGDEKGIDDVEHWPKEILDTFEENRTSMISSIGHELMHAYDMGHARKSETHVSNALYQAYNNERFGIKPIDDFFYYMYYTTRCESIVRNAEVAASMEAQGVEQSKFYDYLKDNTTYKMLKEVQAWTFDGMVADLKANIDGIRETISQYQDLSNLSDEELIDRILGLAVHRINQGSIDHLLNQLQVPSIFGMPLIDPEDDATDEEKNEFIKAFFDVARKNVHDPKKYFRMQESYFHETAGKLIKKLGKLFSLAKPSDENPLHAKISAKGKKNESRISRWNDFGH